MGQQGVCGCIATLSILITFHGRSAPFRGAWRGAAQEPRRTKRQTSRVRTVSTELERLDEGDKIRAGWEEGKSGREGRKKKGKGADHGSDACYPGVWSRVCWISLSLFQSLFLCGFVSGGRLKFNWLHRHRCSCLIPFPGLSCLASFLFLSLHLHLCLSSSLTHRVRFSPVNLQAHMPVL